MNLVLFLFVLPFATIIFSIVLQKIINSPILVALTMFSVYLILAFTVFDESFIVVAVIYAILSYVTAQATRLLKRFLRGCLCGNNTNNESTPCSNEDDTSDLNNNENGCGCNRAELLINNRSFQNRRYIR